MFGQAELAILVKVKDEASAALGKIKGAAAGIGGALKKGALAGGLALAGLGAAAIKMAIDFESSMAEVKTLLPDLADEGFNKLKGDVLSLSKEMGIATDEVVPALYQAISAGVPAENVLEFMTTASQAAIGGVTDLETAVDGITSVTNAYGKEVLSAAEASDIMFTAVRLGKTDFSQLSASLFNVIPTAANLGISFEEVAAGLANMTATGVPTAEATTKMRAAFVEMSKTGSKLDVALRDLAGGSFAELQAQGLDVGEVFAILKDRAEEAGVPFGDLFGSTEALDAGLMFAAESGQAFQDTLAEMQGAAGATEGAFSTIAETTKFKFGKAMNSLKVQLLEVGMKLLPTVTDALALLVPWLEENVPKAVAAMEAAWLSVKPYVLAFGKAVLSGLDVLKDLAAWIASNKPVMIAAIIAVGVAIALALGPGTLAILAIVGLIALLGLLRDNWDEIKATVQGVIDDVIAKVNELPVVGEVFRTVVEVVEEKVDAIVSAVTRIITIATEVIDFFNNIFHGRWGEAWENVKVIASEALGLLLDFIQISFLGTLETVLTQLQPWNWVRAGFNALKDNAIALAGLAADQLVAAIEAIPQRLLNLMFTFKDAARTLGRMIFEGIAEGVKGAFGIAWDIASAVANAIKNLVNTHVIDRINRALEFTIQGPFGLGSVFINPPDIPHLARGAPAFAGGLAVLGEQGPELAILPRGTQVYGAGRTQEIMAGAEDGARTIIHMDFRGATFTGTPAENASAIKDIFDQRAVGVPA